MLTVFSCPLIYTIHTFARICIAWSRFCVVSIAIVSIVHRNRIVTNSMTRDDTTTAWLGAPSGPLRPIGPSAVYYKTNEINLLLNIPAGTRC